MTAFEITIALSFRALSINQKARKTSSTFLCRYRLIFPPEVYPQIGCAEALLFRSP